MCAELEGDGKVPTACFLCASHTGNTGSQTKLEQRHMERLQAKVTVVMAFAADSAPAFLMSLYLAVTAGRNLCPAPGCWDPVTGSLQNLPVLLAVPNWGQH